MSELVTTPTHSHALALDEAQAWWSDRQLAGLRQIGVQDASDGDLLVFFHVCQRTGLDPFARQIHMVGRNTKDGNQWVTKYTIQTGIDGYRLVARRATDRLGETLEYEDTQWCDASGNWSDVWLKSTPPAAARVTVLRHGKRFPGVALYNEYVQTKRDGEPNAMWSRMPANQLAKCAEAMALRKAFPQDLSGIYADEEMGQAERVERREPSGLAAALAPEPAEEPVAPEPDPHAPGPDDVPLLDVPELITAPQLKKLHTVLTNLQMTRDEALPFYASVIGHDVESSKALTKDEAGAVIDALEAVEEGREPAPVAP